MNYSKSMKIKIIRFKVLGFISLINKLNVLGFKYGAHMNEKNKVG